MRNSPAAYLAVVAFAVPAGLTAQTRQEPNLVFTIAGGLTGSRSLWEVPVQRLPVAPAAEDSFALARRLRPGIVAAVSATYYSSPGFGYTMEVGYFGLQTEARCRPLGPYAPDPDMASQQACDRIQGRHEPSSVVGLQAGAVYRINPAGAFSPYVRALAGVGIVGNSFVQTEAVVTSSACNPGPNCLLALLSEEKRREFSWLGSLALGFVAAASPTYKFRLEVRDLMATLPHVDGPAITTAGTLPFAPVSSRLTHNFVLTAGLDIVLERRRGRRY